MIDLSNIPTDKLHEIDYVEIPGMYKASEWGKECHRLRVDEALVAGAAGTGKSFWGLHDAMPVVIVANELCRRGLVKWGTLVDDQCLHIRRKTGGLDTTIRRAAPVFKAIDPNVRYREKQMTFVFSSGLQFVFGHCKDPNDWENYYTHSYVHMFFDELTQFTRDQYEHISSRGRATNPILRKMVAVRGASNPGPGWVRDLFVDPAPGGRKVLTRKLDDGTTATRIFIPATIDDNPDKGFVEQFKRKLMSRPEHIKRALLYGDWWVTADSYFAEHWRPDLHIIDPFRIPGDWPRFRSLDWGYKSYGCVHWWAVDPDGNLICEKEYTFRFKDGDEVALAIRGIEERMGLWDGRRSKITGPADTNLWGETSSADSHAERMARLGVTWVRADKKSRKMNAERVLARLDSHGGGIYRPGIVFFRGMTDNIIKTLPTIPADADNPDPDKQDTPKKCDIDHWYDSVSYACIASFTPVTTPRGQVRIDELSSSDKVLGADGCWHPCKGGFMTKRSAPVFDVELGNGQTLRATPDHRILTSSGIWKRIDMLDAGDYAFAPWIPSFAAERDRTSTETGTTSAGSTTAGGRKAAGESFFTERFGRRFTEILRRGWTSTTSMETGRTTQSRTWLKSKLASIAASTVGSLQRQIQGIGSRLLPQRGILRKLGTGAQRAWLGTGSTVRRFLDRPSIRGMRFVFNVVSDLTIEALGRMRNSVAGSAPPKAAANPALTTSNGFALPAGEFSWCHGSVVPKPVLGDAVRILSVKPAGETDVFCTSVPVMGAFVASGVVISNCSYRTRDGESMRRRIEARKMRAMDDDDTPKKKRRNRGDWGKLGYGA